ncbi:unnamed protein product [Didymodactylos carnosus]|uniref:JmjC domain-containing protein n=1 Tax=Didymodactylos carnosus TaxID=1234261 RepID=A0A813QTH3_9BILA|nr:unnamed protein product [Didymodactylos carnosus]CAF1170245.1 unnamed protein product [Didymodactylos carnosus]CAF3553657.1 unnamed protein product [Didymodactylos carnosus]CAF3981600.1 unnamed protein product [Didymodactylos carnosus]
MPTIHETNDLNEAIDIVQDENKRYPFILHNFDIGPCRQKWTCDYLASKIGSKPVRIHVSQEPILDFVRKNFTYETLPFDEVVRRCENVTNEKCFVSPTEHYYFRALGENVRTDIANIEKSFPSIVDDIRYPPLFSNEQLFSSVFRIGSPNTTLWTHYDIMDNILIQVRGSKRLIMFPPGDISYLYIDGDKSLVANLDSIDDEMFPLIKKATFYTGTLQTGDCLFIPALWFHNIKSLETAVSVNVFWRHLPIEMYESKDIYGNKDLVPFSKQFGQLTKCVNEINKLQEPYADFYLKRMLLYMQKSIEDRKRIQKET